MDFGTVSNAARNKTIAQHTETGRIGPTYMEVHHEGRDAQIATQTHSQPWSTASARILQGGVARQNDGQFVNAKSTLASALRLCETGNM